METKLMIKRVDVVSGFWLLAVGQSIPGWSLSNLNLFVYMRVHLHSYAQLLVFPSSCSKNVGRAPQCGRTLPKFSSNQLQIRAWLWPAQRDCLPHYRCLTSNCWVDRWVPGTRGGLRQPSEQRCWIISIFRVKQTKQKRVGMRFRGRIFPVQ